MRPEDLLARVLYRDPHVLVIDKPAGLAVHPGPRTERSLEQYLPALRFGLAEPPRLAHRLDRDTSGCLVLGRHQRAIRRLGRLFAAGKVEKTYWTIVAGEPPGEEGAVELPILKINRKTGWRIVTDPAGQPALTQWRVLARIDGFAWIEARPRTGRTHQIRVHMQALGCPVLGDPFYARADMPPGPMQLHARSIAFRYGEGGASVHAAAPAPPHMRAALAAYGLAGNGDADRVIESATKPA